MSRQIAPRIALAATVVAIPLVVAGALSASGSAQSSPQGRTVHVIATSGANFESSGRFGNGSIVGFRDRLTLDNATRGRSVGVCTIVDVKRKEALCHVRLVLADGEIALELLNRETAATQRAAVVGGTGAYAAARGSAIAKNAAKNKTDITVTLID